MQIGKAKHLVTNYEDNKWRFKRSLKTLQEGEILFQVSRQVIWKKTPNGQRNTWLNVKRSVGRPRVCPLFLRILGIVCEASMWSYHMCMSSNTMLFSFMTVTIPMAQQLSSIIIFGHFIIKFSIHIFKTYYVTLKKKKNLFYR